MSQTGWVVWPLQGQDVRVGLVPRLTGQSFALLKGTREICLGPLIEGTNEPNEVCLCTYREYAFAVPQFLCLIVYGFLFWRLRILIQIRIQMKC